MYIYLDKSLNRIVEDPRATLKYMTILSDILKSDYDGTHVIDGDLDLLINITKSEYFDIVCKSISRELIKKANDLEQVRNIVIDKVIVMDMEKDIFKENRSIYISMDFIQKKRLNLKYMSVLLCENKDDSIFYNLLGEYYAYAIGLSKYSTQYYPCCGGGHTTYLHLESYRDFEPRLCLCIADTDKKYKDSPIGETLNEINKVDLRNNEFCCIEEIDVHEAENLLPFSVIRHVLTELGRYDNCQSNQLAEVSILETQKYLEMKKYYDFKEGIKLYKIGDMIEIDKAKKRELDFNEYWFNGLIIQEKSDKYEKMLKEYNSIQDEDTKKIYSQKHVFPNIKKNILAELIDFIKDDSRKNDLIKNCFSHIHHGEWCEIGHIVLSWCIASNSDYRLFDIEENLILAK